MTFNKECDVYMIDDKICELREKLNRSIIEGEDYDIIYKISIELDDLIANYYNQENQKKKKNKSEKFLSIF